MADADAWRDHFSDRPFGAVFAHPRSYPPDRWRVRGSGVHARPDSAPTTAAVLAVCEDLGIATEVYYSTGPCSADSFPVEAKFLDGGLSGETGNYIGGERGVTVTGAKAVLLLALSLGLRVRPAWYAEYGLEGVDLEDLLRELRCELKKRRRPRRVDEHTHGPGMFIRGPRRFWGLDSRT
jgi:hypothetical protein